MKKFSFLFLSVLLLAFTGCNQEEPPVPDPTPTLEVSASPDTIPYLGSSVISWKSDHSDYVLVNTQKMGTEDSLVVEGLTSSTLYTITAVGSNNKSVVKDVMITVGKADAPTVYIVSPGPIPYGTSTSFSWTTNGLVTSVTIDGVVVSDSTFKTQVLYESKEYTLILEGPGGTFEKNVTINVLPQKKYKISTTCGQNGSVLPGCNVIVAEGEDTTLTFKPKDGFEVESLKVDGVNVTPTSSLTLSNVTSDKNVEVSFKFKYAESTIEWYFTQFVWVESKYESLIEGYWYNFPVDDSDKNIYRFNPDGTKWNHEKSAGTWSFDKTTNPITLVNGIAGIDPSKVEFIDSMKMVLSCASGAVTNKITYTNDGVRRFK